MTLKKRRDIIITAAVVIIYYFSLPAPLFNDPVCIVLEDKNDNLLGAHISSDGQWRFPDNNIVSGKFKKALVAYEDRRFYFHQGFDPIALGRALIANLKAGKKISGGSTLTMQVIRLARKGRSRTVFEKFIEIYLATRLECTHTKNEILALYASHAPFGGNIVGLDAAAWIYFGRNQHRLSWAESAMLAVLPNSPSLVHPGKNRKFLKIKRDRLLKKMYQKKIIDQNTYELSVDEPIPEKPNNIPRIAPHLLSRIYNENKNAEKTISTFHTTLDVTLQNNVTHILENHADNLLRGNGIYNAATLVIEVESGNVVAYVGNIGDLNDKRYGANVDIINAPRSTGSVLKPFLYAAMLSSGDILPKALVPDIPTQISGYAPKNFNLGYDGAVPARRAIARSLNIPAIRMLQNYGIAKFLYILKKLGMTTVTKNAEYYGLSLILGGCEGKLWELAGIYASMARSLNHFINNSGRYDPDDYRPPNFIFSKNKKMKSKFFTSLEKSSVLTASTIWLTFNTMIDVERPAEESNWQYFSSSRKIAWKTGTSFGFRDGWAIGVTPAYVVGVWVGNADGEGRPNLTGIHCAAPILFDVFNLLPHSGKWFNQPFDDMYYTATCRRSGYLASDICEEVDSVWLPKAGIHFQKCPYHKLVHLDKTEKWRVHSNCEEPSSMVHKSWFILPPVMEWYYKSKNYDYKTLPDYRPDCLANLLHSSSKPMEIIYPKDLTKIYVPVELDGKLGSTVFEVAHRNQNITIFWYIDTKFAGSTSRFHHIALQPPKGKHTLTLVDENGEKIEQTFEIIDKK
ncbi:MAG: penicillin-binding protein 1C [Bacteroidia bacterium]|nr:penicillin-binding protein 1C [Bacteroidia bacterium]